MTPTLTQKQHSAKMHLLKRLNQRYKFNWPLNLNSYNLVHAIFMQEAKSFRAKRLCRVTRGQDCYYKFNLNGTDVIVFYSQTAKTLKTALPRCRKDNCNSLECLWHHGVEVKNYLIV